jgi:ATP-dependent exoDNAse (exonuclease V) beta subunit
MQRTTDKPGYEIFITKGWDYAHLCETYEKAVKLAREEHIPVLVHVKEVNQPQGHSTSGSHERYKSAERLEWETTFDCIHKFKEWILSFEAKGMAIASEEELNSIQATAKELIRSSKNNAWSRFTDSMKQDQADLVSVLKTVAAESTQSVFIQKDIETLEKEKEPIRRDLLTLARKVLRQVREENISSKKTLGSWIQSRMGSNFERYSSHLHSQSAHSAMNVPAVAPKYADDVQMEDGRIILRENYRTILESRPEVLVPQDHKVPSVLIAAI